MPGAKAHALIGAVAGGLLSHWLLPDDTPHRGWKILAACTVGAAVALVPDKLEPALNPNHRALFHSLLTAAAVIYGGKKSWDYLKATGGRSEDAWLALIAFSAAAGYGSHLAADALTSKSLPLLGMS